MTQPANSQRPLLMMAGGQGQPLVQQADGGHVSMAANQTQNPAAPLTIIPMMSSTQPFQPFQFVSGPGPQMQQYPGHQQFQGPQQFQGHQMQQYPAPTYVIQQPTGANTSGDRTQFLVPQQVQYIQQPQYILAQPGQQIQHPQQSLIQGGNQIQPTFFNPIQLVPSSTITYKHKPLSPILGDMPGGMIWKIPSQSSPRLQSPMVSPPIQPTLPFQHDKTVDTTKESDISSKESTYVGGDESRGEREEEEEEMVPISLKNKYENIQYNPELEPMYLTGDINLTGNTRLPDVNRTRRRRLQEYLRDRPIKKITPPTPMFAIYQLREQNWKRKLTGEDGESDTEENQTMRERHFRTLSEILGNMHDDTFTRLDEDQFKSSHHNAYPKKPIKRISVDSSDSDSEDYENDVFEEEVKKRGPARHKARLESFGFDTPPERVVSTTKNTVLSTTEVSQSSKDSAFSDGSNVSNTSGDRQQQQILQKDNESEQRIIRRDSRKNVITIEDEMEYGQGAKFGRHSDDQPLETPQLIEKISPPPPVAPSKSMRTQCLTEFKQGGGKKRVKSPAFTFNVKRKKTITLGSSYKKVPLRRPRQTVASRKAELLQPHNWLEKASLLATSTLRERSIAQQRRTSRFK